MDKSARREAIIAVVTQSLASRSFDGVTMAEIARRCGLAKGTLYLYYETKEELLLATLERELGAWYDALANGVRQRGLVDARSFAAVVLDALGQRRALIDLLPRLRPMLEATATPQPSAQGFRRRIGEQLASTADAVETALALPRGSGASIVTRTQALVAGLSQAPGDDGGTTSPTSATRAFERELAAAVTAMVRGMVGAYA